MVSLHLKTSERCLSVCLFPQITNKSMKTVVALKSGTSKQGGFKMTETDTQSFLATKIQASAPYNEWARNGIIETLKHIFSSKL